MKYVILGLILVGFLSTTLNVSAQDQSIPDWIKETARLWAENLLPDADFINSMEYLIDKDIIQLSNPPAKSLTIGFIPVEKADELTSKANALVEFLEKEIPGTDIEIVVPTNYETIIEGMRFGHVDAAFMDTGPAWITHQRTGASVVLAEVVEGKVNYQATIWGRVNDTSINSLQDTINKRVAFTSITGSSGFVRPMGTLVTDGIIDIQGNDIIALQQALVDSFKAHTFAGGYKAALELLLNDKVDVAFGSDIAPQKYLDIEDQSKLRVIDTIGPVPSHVFMTSADMSAETQSALVSALIKLNHQDNNAILSDLYGADALLPTSTTMHIGEFGTFIDTLTGLDQLILAKYNKNK